MLTNDTVRLHGDGETQSSFTSLGVSVPTFLCLVVAGWASPVHSLPEGLQQFCVGCEAQQQRIPILRNREWELTEVYFNEL